MHEFVHLHNHTHYSLLDAMPTVPQLIDAALEDNQKALALTDHGVMHGAIEFYYKAKAKGLKPLIGMEAYVANGSRFDKTPRSQLSGKKEKQYFHLVLLAKDMTGYCNLVKLTSLGHTEGFYYKPRVDKELLEQYREGLVALSACIGGVVNIHLVNGDFEKAREEARYYQQLYGDDFYIELQDHGLKPDKIVLRDAPRIAQDLGIKIVATNDIHYISKDHAVAHNVLLHIRDVTAATAGTVDIEKLRYQQPEFWFKSQQDMNKLFRNFPDAVKNTAEVADKCNLEFEQKLFMPEFDIPEESPAETLEDFLVETTYNGLDMRFDEITPEIRERADYELNIINTMGFAGYFLIVQDFILAAKKLGVSVGPGRGSAAGSLVAYALEITNVDPLRYDLLFERFLNPERVSMPDIDIDFADDKRERVIEYVKEKYGEESVAQIVTFGKLSSRAALTDVGRVLGVPLSTIKDITKKIPVVRGKVLKLKEAFKLPDLKEYSNSEDKSIQDLIKFSQLVENINRGTGVHAAGVVIAPGPITNYVPISRAAKSRGQSVDSLTQYSMNELETAGLLKMDFLGLRTLSIIENTLDMIRHNHGKDINIDEIDFEDEKTLDLLGNGKTLAVFQFESGGMQDYLKKLKPRNLEEITAMNALYRPGPMENIPEFIDRKFERKPIKYLHEIMEPALKNTYGIIVYQEQVMQLVRDIAGFSLGQADVLRRAMGKKKTHIMDEQKPIFVEGAAKKGIDKKLALEIFDLIYKFADYGFNKSHSLAYSYVAYQTAWLKANYTAEFLAANMTAEVNDQAKIVELIDEARKFGIEVQPPDINRSRAEFSVSGNNIFFGMAAIRNVGASAVEKIVEERAEKPFISFFDFVSRVDTRLINRRALEALICAGAFDSVSGGKRAALFEAIDSALDYSKAFEQSRNMQMDSLFAGGGEEDATIAEPTLPEVPEWSDREKLDKEKEMLSFYVSGNPLDEYWPYVQSLASFGLEESTSPAIGKNTRIVGLVSSIRKRMDRRNNTIAFVMIEDFKGKAECIFWSDSFARWGKYLQEGRVLVLCGKSETDDDLIKMVVEEVVPIEDTLKRFAKGYKIWIDLANENISEESIRSLKAMNGDFDTNSKMVFNIYNSANGYKTAYNIYDARIPLRHESVKKLGKIFGIKNIGILTS